MYGGYITKILALAAVVTPWALAAAPTTLTVWIPEQGQTATLSSGGLVAADGHQIRFYPRQDGPLEVPLSNGFARLTPATRAKPARLEVLRGGQVTASRLWPENPYPYALVGTERGPCIWERDERKGSTKQRCFTPDLKPDPNTVWAKVPMSAFMSKGSKATYTVQTDWEAKNPLSDEVKVIRRDLQTGQEVTLSYRVPLPGYTLVPDPGTSDPFDRRARVTIAAELPGERYLLCVNTTLPKDPCRLDVVDRNFKKLFGLQGNAYTHSPAPTKDGTRLFYLGNTLQVWDAQTGKQLSNIHNPLWEKRNEYPFLAYLTPDGTQTAIITNIYTPKPGPTPDHFTAYLYRLKDGVLLNSFAITQGHK